MCGIAGIVSLDGSLLPPGTNLLRPLAALQHRGPDGIGQRTLPGAILGTRRLALSDPEAGHQPLLSNCRRFALVFNGEIYDSEVHRRRLSGLGIEVRARCDTEVLLQLLIHFGSEALDRIDGQFALAFYDSRERRLLLARDRMGISPLFYACTERLLVFGSEAKALFATGLIEPAIDPQGLDAITAFGAVPAPRTIFQGVHALPPGTSLTLENSRLRHQTYWDLDYPDAGDYAQRSPEAWARDFRAILGRAVRRRLVADAPVGLYLSGGIDSGAVAALAVEAAGSSLPTFSVRFQEPGFDEGSGIHEVAGHLGLDPQELVYSQDQLARDLRHFTTRFETPLISTESFPLAALSGLASTQVKAVLTGEGSDEALGGYLYFVWEKVRLALEANRLGRLPLAVLRKILAHHLGEANGFFPPQENLRWAEEVFGFLPASGLFSFYWRGLRTLVYSPEMLERSQRSSDADFVHLPERIRSWDPLHRSLYVSSRLFMTSHLLAAHGDRALMAHSVEGRYPFLDREVQEFLARVPPSLKIRFLEEKHLLRRALATDLPRGVLRRTKKPFLAPFGTPFVGPDAPEEVRELLDRRRVEDFGFFDPEAVESLTRLLEPHRNSLGADRGESLRIDRSTHERTTAGMALTLVVTTQALEAAIREGRLSRPEEAAEAAVSEAA